MTRKNKEYSVVHKTSKLICALINTLLFITVLEIDKPVLFFILNLTYFFGVNTISRVIEKVLHITKKHEWL